MAELLAAAPLAPAAPAAGMTAALILLLFVWVVLWGLQQGYNYSLGALLRRFASAVGGIRVVGGPLEAAIEKVDNVVREAIGAGLGLVDRSVAELWRGLEWLVRETYDALVDFASDTHDAIEGLITHEIPAQVDARTGKLVKGIDRLGGRLRALDRELTGDIAATRARLERELADLYGRARRGIDAIRAHDIPRLAAAIAGVTAGLAGLGELVRGGLSRRIGALESRLAAGFIGAVAIAALTRVWPWWQCRNVRSASRALCRMPFGMLDDLLVTSVAVLALSDICTLTAAIRRAGNAFLPVLRGLVVVADAATQCTDIEPLLELPIAAHAPPPSERLALLA